MKSEWFTDWFDSPYYHILYQSHDDREAKLFIDNLLRILPLPDGARVLDLACGKGRHARYLAEKGFDVTGLDVSGSNIAFARHFEHERLSFYQHDMRHPFRINYFDAILNIFTSFGYFSTDQDHVNSLRNVNKGLKPGGLFVLDFFNAAWVRDHLIRMETKSLDGIDFHLKKYIRGKHVFKQVLFETGGRRFQFRERVRLFLPDDFKQMFSAAGLQLLDTYGDHNLEPFDPLTSKRLILLAEKPC
ncbi:MAG: class I SAM-dependent methyltransferase [Thermoanaerobaculia bacterium]|nr:class I SAM-dependent methyltransferase [Thermoanaerobaculia bacterium]